MLFNCSRTKFDGSSRCVRVSVILQNLCLTILTFKTWNVLSNTHLSLTFCPQKRYKLVNPESIDSSVSEVLLGSNCTVNRNCSGTLIYSWFKGPSWTATLPLPPLSSTFETSLPVPKLATTKPNPFESGPTDGSRLCSVLLNLLYCFLN